MRYSAIDSTLFRENRKRLYAKLLPNSAVLIRSNDVLPSNGDGVLPFVQNSDLFYLSGIDQEETYLLLAPDFPNEHLREILFLRETSDEIATWEGHKLTKQEGKDLSGIPHIVWNDQWERLVTTILAETDHVYLMTNEHIRNSSVVQTANDRLIDWCKQKFPLHQFHRLTSIIYPLRMIKSQLEVKLIEHACQITEKGFRRILDEVSPGVWEYEIEAEYSHVFLSNRSRGFAYTPIIAGGKNSCVLHYIDNNQQLRDGDLLLMDVGAEYANYKADMTRTIPVNGRFTKRQKQVYEAVLRVKIQATDLLKPGNTIPEYHQAVGEIMTEELLELGLLSQEEINSQTTENPAYRRYFMHGTSHHLGLDVHDVGSVYRKFEPGMVFTVEPGIYIPEEGIGIRLEDNILITEKDHLNLMRNIPIHVEEIEDLMNSK